MKWIKKIILFALVLFLYFLPSLIFKTDLEFYHSLKGPKLPSIVFPIVWTVIYILLSLFVVYLFDHRKEVNRKDFARVLIFLVVNYLISFTLLNKVYFLAISLLFLAF